MSNRRARAFGRRLFKVTYGRHVGRRKYTRVHSRRYRLSL